MAPKPAEETPNENITVALQSLEHISNLNIVNIHPKALETTSVNISIGGNQPHHTQNVCIRSPYYNRSEPVHEHANQVPYQSDEVASERVSSSAFHQFMKQQDQHDARFTDAKCQDWCLSHHPRLSSTLLKVQIPIQTAANNVHAVASSSKRI